MSHPTSRLRVVNMFNSVNKTLAYRVSCNELQTPVFASV